MIRGEDFADADERRWRPLRGDRVAMIFQDPMTALNPYLRIERQLVEVWTAHRSEPKAAGRARARELLALCGLPDPDRVLRSHPHELSGGMRQRVVIAMALMLEPEVIFADEPTTALDSTTQAQILDLLVDLKARINSAIVFITHDLGIVAGIADRVAIMYAGQVLEQGPAEAVLRAPRHPYTQGLIASIPQLEGTSPERLQAIPGQPPNPLALPPGCAFAPRCERRQDSCETQPPSLVELEAGRWLRCPVAEEDAR